MSEDPVVTEAEMRIARTATDGMFDRHERGSDQATDFAWKLARRLKENGFSLRTAT